MTERKATRRPLAAAVLAAAACIVAASRAGAQSLEPRAYSPNPTGMNFAIAGYTYQFNQAWQAGHLIPQPTTKIARWKQMTPLIHCATPAVVNSISR